MQTADTVCEESHIARLISRCNRQSLFCRDASPLYARIFELVARWLAEATPCGRWLATAAADRAPFDVPMLLASGLHYLALEGRHASDLAEFFPTTGGTAHFTAPSFAMVLERTILENSPFLERWLAEVYVQTNESARGIGWFLPLLYTPWQNISLLDIGASAGLNLVADKRCYTLTPADGGQPEFKIGAAAGDQFMLSCDKEWVQPASHLAPCISSRTGIDYSPLPLETLHDRLVVESFVWADQPDRLRRLREGIEAFSQSRRHDENFLLERVVLPDGFPDFLESYRVCEESEAILFYSSYIKNYLPDKGKSLLPMIETYAGKQRRPVLWLQQDLDLDREMGTAPPAFGWVLWSAHLFMAGKHHFFPLAWCHPHGAHLCWLGGIREWNDYWQDVRNT